MKVKKKFKNKFSLFQNMNWPNKCYLFLKWIDQYWSIEKFVRQLGFRPILSCIYTCSITYTIIIILCFKALTQIKRLMRTSDILNKFWNSFTLFHTYQAKYTRSDISRTDLFCRMVKNEYFSTIVSLLLLSSKDSS